MALLIMALELMIIALFLLLPTTLSQPLGSQCPGYRYPDNSTFQSNLHALLSTLNSNSIRSTFNTSVAGADSPDGVYGLYFCTSDLPQPNCHNCIATAASDILQLCPKNRQGVVWYNYCQLRYSDQPFFGLADPTGFGRVVSGPNISDLTQPLEILSGLVEEASKGRPDMFGYHASLWEGMYAMAQCSGDLNASGCAACLETVLEKGKMCCSQASAWSYLTYSCRMRFDVTPFLQNIDLSNQMVGYKCTGNISTDLDMVTLAHALTIGASPTGFYNTSIASNGSRLYGLALCRGDIDPHTCGKCLNESVTDMTKNCIGRMGGMVWYEKCSIRLANWDFFGVIDDDAMVFCNRSEGIVRDDKSIGDLMSRLVELAVDKPLMYAQGNMSISGSLTGFGSAQCSRDLSSEACRRCLLEGVRNVSSQCKGRKGWGYFSGSCSLRYEEYAFFRRGGEPLYPLPKLKIRGKILTIMIVAIAAAVFLLVLVTSIYILLRKKFSGSKGEEWICSALLTDNNKSILINMETLRAATNNFSDANKLGEGGFGPVYKGQLPDGKEIAVKRLSPASSHGHREFKNEIRLIAKLQHRNLVRMLGSCIKGEEKLLVYEYLTNGSLDSFLIDPNKRLLLDWRARRHIIFGIARGLVYLHEESRLKVVHRDLKASNILLDLKMNAKIADFGMARIFKLDENEAHTRKVVGTYGYMAPEYAMHGIFSTKSDVFSFGVLLLEIVSGQKNGRSHFIQHGQTLLKRAWQLWQEGNGEDLIDPMVAGSCDPGEAARAIHTALLCVQEDADDRPAMSVVLHMLRNGEMALPAVRKPSSSYMRGEPSGSAKTSTRGGDGHRFVSVNGVSLTAVEAR